MSKDVVRTYKRIWELAVIAGIALIVNTLRREENAYL